MVPGSVPHVLTRCWLIPSGRRTWPPRQGHGHGYRVFPRGILPCVSGLATSRELIHFWQGSLRIYVCGA